VRALLVDQSRDRATLVAARCLARAGYTVATGAFAPSFASTSRYVQRHHEIRECEDGEDEFVADIAAAVAAGGYDIVFCSYDVGLVTLSRRREEIGPAVWPYAPYESVRRAFDKLELARAAQRAGLRAPRTELASAAAVAAWRGPAVVKARSHVPKRFDTELFASARDGQGLIDQIHAEGGEALLQEVMSGAMGAVVLVADRDGQIAAEVHQEAVHTWPPGAGDTVRGRIVSPDPELSRGVRALVADIGWLGLVQVEFMRDAAGVAHITDFNGRFYGSLALATGAGANLPAIWADQALGRDTRLTEPPRIGAGFQWLNRDLAASYALGPRALAGALLAAPRDSHSMWDARDPSPCLRYLLPEAGRRLHGCLRPGAGA
jgi:predicted ATP-grasp superfamily ATP-dependent carboligase